MLRRAAADLPTREAELKGREQSRPRHHFGPLPSKYFHSKYIQYTMGQGMKKAVLKSSCPGRSRGLSLIKGASSHALGLSDAEAWLSLAERCERDHNYHARLDLALGQDC